MRVNPTLVAAIVLFCGVFLGSKPAQAQLLTTPASDVNRIAYVANAIDKLHNQAAPERVALAVFVVKMYSLDNDAQYVPNPSPNHNPNLAPHIALRYMAQAQDKFNTLYRELKSPGRMRMQMTEYDAISNMLGILATQTGNPIAVTLAGESLNFQTGVGYRVSDAQTLYLDQSNFQGRSRVNGGVYKYRSRFLEKMYNLAQTNANVRDVVDAFFGKLFNARVTQTAKQILDSNTALRDSQNFRPFYDLILPNGSIQVTRAQFNNLATDFIDRMASVTTQAMVGTAQHPESFAMITNLQKANYADFYLNPFSVNASAAREAAVTVQQVVAPKLASAGAAAYALPFTVAPDPAYVAYEQTVATLEVTEATARLAANTVRAAAGWVAFGITPAPQSAVDAAAATIDVIGDAAALTARTLDMAAAFGAFGASTEDAILEGVNKLSEQLFQVQQQVNARLDIIDSKIDTVYTVMNNQFASVKSILVTQGALLSQIQQQVSGLQSAVNAVQGDVYRLSQSIFDFSNVLARANLKTTLVNIDTHVRNGTTISSDQYQNLYAVVLAYAISGSRDSTEVSSLGSRSYTDLGLVQELSSGPFPEWNINYMLEFVRLKFGIILNPTGTPVPNPRAWAMSVMGMMRLAAANPTYYLSTTQNDKPLPASGFFAARNAGRDLQAAVANCTLRFNPSLLRYERSPLFETLLQFQQTKLNAILAALSQLETDAGGTLANKVAYIKTQWTTNSPTEHGQALQNAYRELDGARALLNNFVQLGLSRALSQDEFLKSFLYSPQRLPDALVIYNPAETTPSTAKSLYAKWQTGNPNPRETLIALQTQRYQALSQHILVILDRILANTTFANAVGQPLAEVDNLLQRFGFYTQTRVGGHVQAMQGALRVGEPVYITFRSRTGSQPTFTIPVLLDVGGNFTVSIVEDNYDVLIQADRFLVKGYYAINTNLGNITVGSGVINASLRVGDVSGDNIINNTDLILLRNAFGTTPAHSRWNPFADLNGDNIINNTDLNLLRANWGLRGDF